MFRRLILVFIVNVLLTLCTYGQVRIRLFSSQSPESAVFSVTGGRYELNSFNGQKLYVNKDEPVIITRFNGKLAVKTRYDKGFECDSLVLHGVTDKDYFSLRLNGNTPVRQYYSGDLKGFPDLGTILLINTCDIETYIAGVVRAESGKGRNKEYIKTQAILTRTYMYKYFDRHTYDRYNLCDNTHCQAFNGLSQDSMIEKAALETKNLVILDHDSALIISAFHSNCGGETSPPEDVWLTSKQYIKNVVDSYCLSSPNSTWEKRLSINDWLSLMKKLGYEGKTDDPAAFVFLQKSRQYNYRTGSFTIPFKSIRTELNLRSTFFSVLVDRDSIILKGRGYGHGVGLCQEGAMAMAEKGLTYKQIINFYYSDIIITDIKNAVYFDGNIAYKHAAGSF